MVPLNIYKIMQMNKMQRLLKKTGFKIKNEIEGQGQSSPKSKRILTVLIGIVGPIWENLERW